MASYSNTHFLRCFLVILFVLGQVFGNFPENNAPHGNLPGPTDPQFDELLWKASNGEITKTRGQPTYSWDKKNPVPQVAFYSHVELRGAKKALTPTELFLLLKEFHENMLAKWETIPIPHNRKLPPNRKPPVSAVLVLENEIYVTTVQKGIPSGRGTAPAVLEPETTHRRNFACAEITALRKFCEVHKINKVPKTNTAFLHAKTQLKDANIMAVTGTEAGKTEYMPACGITRDPECKQAIKQLKINEVPKKAIAVVKKDDKFDFEKVRAKTKADVGVMGVPKYGDGTVQPNPQQCCSKQRLLKRAGGNCVPCPGGKLPGDNKPYTKQQPALEVGEQEDILVKPSDSQPEEKIQPLELGPASRKQSGSNLLWTTADGKQLLPNDVADAEFERLAGQSQVPDLEKKHGLKLTQIRQKLSIKFTPLVNKFKSNRKTIGIKMKNGVKGAKGAAVALPAYGYSIAVAFRKGTRYWDRAAAVTSILPVAGCIVEDVANEERGQSDPGGFAECIALDVLEFTPLAPFVMLYRGGKLLYTSITAFLNARKESIDPEDLALLRNQTWQQICANVSEEFSTADFKSSLDDDFLSEVATIIWKKSNATGELQKSTLRLLENAADDEREALLSDRDAKERSLRDSMCEDLRKTRNSLRADVINFLAQRLHDAAMSYDIELWENWKPEIVATAWSEKSNAALKRLRQEVKDHPLYRHEASRRLLEVIGDDFDERFGRVHDQVPPCKGHEPGLYAQDPTCPEPCGSVARRETGRRVGWGQTLEGKGIWGCLIYRHGTGYAEGSPDCCYYKAFQKKGVWSNGNGTWGDHFEGERCVEPEAETPRLFEPNFFRRPPPLPSPQIPTSSTTSSASTAVPTLTRNPVCQKPCLQPTATKTMEFVEIDGEGKGIFGCQSRNLGGINTFERSPVCCLYREMKLQMVPIGRSQIQRQRCVLDGLYNDAGPAATAWAGYGYTE